MLRILQNLTNLNLRIDEYVFVKSYCILSSTIVRIYENAFKFENYYQHGENVLKIVQTNQSRRNSCIMRVVKYYYYSC